MLELQHSPIYATSTSNKNNFENNWCLDNCLQLLMIIQVDITKEQLREYK